MRLLRSLGYLLVFVFSFVVFLYLMFPYDALKDRAIVAIEEQLGGNVQVSIETFEPYYLSGVEISKMNIDLTEQGQVSPLLRINEATGRAGLISLLMGRPNISFWLRSGKGELEGSVSQREGLWDIELFFDRFDLSALAFLQSRFGLNVNSAIDGDVALRFDQQAMARSTGDVNLTFPSLSLAESEFPIGDDTIPVPALVFSQGENSKLDAKVEKGTIALQKLVFAGGDLGVDLSGKIFMSATPANFRLNLNGSFSASEKLGEALPFLFIVEKQKRADGTYPLTITGRLAKPNVKIGSFTLPL